MMHHKDHFTNAIQIVVYLLSISTTVMNSCHFSIMSHKLYHEQQTLLHEISKRCLNLCQDTIYEDFLIFYVMLNILNIDLLVFGRNF